MWQRVLLFCVLSGCTQFPQLDGKVSDDVADLGFPKLVPLNDILADPGLDAAEQIEVTDTLLGRVAALQARAAGLRGPVIPPRNRRQMQRGVEVPDVLLDETL